MNDLVKLLNDLNQGDKIEYSDYSQLMFLVQQVENENNNMKTENEKLKCDIYNTEANLQLITIEYEKENAELNKKIRRYEEMLGSIFEAGNMIMQEKSKYEELRRV